MPALAIFIQHSIGSSSHSNQAKKIKGIHIGKQVVKLSLLVGESESRSVESDPL